MRVTGYGPRLLNEKRNLTDREIIERGSRALIKELGYSGFLRFIRHSEGPFLAPDEFLKATGSGGIINVDRIEIVIKLNIVIQLYFKI